MDTGTWISLIGAAVSAGVTYGILSNQVGNLKTAHKDLKEEWNRSRERTGERLEALGKEVATLKERLRHRPVTRGMGVPEVK